MPGLRRLTGPQVVRILESFGFEAIQVRGSHHKLRRVVNGQRQTLILIIPVHGNGPLATGTLSAIYRQACRHIPEAQLRPHFYTD